MMNRRLIEVAVDHVFEIFENYQTEFDPPLTYPKYAIRILIVGLADLYYNGIKDPGIYHVLLMEILGVKVKDDGSEKVVTKIQTFYSIHAIIDSQDMDL